MQRWFLSVLFVIFAGLAASQAYAARCQQTDIELVGTMGVTETGAIYVTTRESNRQCGCNNMRFSPARANTDHVMSVLLAARLANKKVRIDLENASNCNTAYRVYIQ